MPACLLALGSNLGDRADQLRRAVAELSRWPQTKLVARSAWLATAPVGGPPGQGPFLNGAALIDTSLQPAALYAELTGVESRLGRVRNERWQARTLDLDVLLYGHLSQHDPALTLPHPRMQFRRFVLEPAAEIAGWMVHPESGWTVTALLNQLNHGAEEIAVAAADPQQADQLIAELSRRLSAGATAPAPLLVRWRPNNSHSRAASSRPKLILAPAPTTGGHPAEWRKILHLPDGGPVAWLPGGAPDAALHEALAAVHSVWPALAAN